MRKIKYLYVVLGLVLSAVLCGCSEDEGLTISEIPSVESEAVSEERVAETSAESPEDGTIYVYVLGAVNKPGVYDFPKDARIFSVIERAGGFRDDAVVESINLAGTAEDGSIVKVLNRDEYARSLCEAESQNIGDSSVGSDGVININTATVSELTELNGIGESRAEAIVSYREENGAFRSPEDIKNVSGIKDGLYNKIKDRIKV